MALSHFFFVALLYCIATVVVVDALQVTYDPPLLDVPTYSLATLNEDGSTNMNIVTYATPVSIRPDRVWTLGMFKDTLSQENIMRNPVCVLQLLRDQHADLVRSLGGNSGRDINKKEECAKLGFEWEELQNCNGLEVLPGCEIYLKLCVQGGCVDAGSHLIVPFCRVEKMYTDNDGSGAGHLSTGRLRELGIITEQGRVATLEKTP